MASKKKIQNSGQKMSGLTLDEYIIFCYVEVISLSLT